MLAGCTTSTLPTTTATTSTTTTTALVRLYYASPGDPANPTDYSNRKIDSACSTDGINFTPDPGSRLTGGYLSAPDLIKEASGRWTMFYSKALTSDASANTKLFKATGTTAAGTFSADALFVDNYGNVSSAIQIGSTWYVFGSASNGNLLLSSYDPAADNLTYVKKVADEGYDPSVIQVGSYYLLFYKIVTHTYVSKSFDGLTWGTADLVVNNAEVPGAIYLGGKIYLYYVDSFTESPTSGKILLRTSSDGGLTFGEPAAINGLPDRASDPCPMEYE